MPGVKSTFSPTSEGYFVICGADVFILLRTTPGWRPVSLNASYAEKKKAAHNFWADKISFTLSSKCAKSELPHYVSDLVSISLSFQTTTFHYSPSSLPPVCPSPLLTHSATFFPCLPSCLPPSTSPLPSLPLSAPPPLHCTPFPGAWVKKPKVKKRELSICTAFKKKKKKVIRNRHAQTVAIKAVCNVRGAVLCPRAKLSEKKRFHKILH